MQGLRPKDEIHVRRPLLNGFTLLARHTAGNTDHDILAGILDLFPTSQL